MPGAQRGSGARKGVAPVLALTMAFALASILATAGCGQLPRPFQPSAKDVDLQALLARKTLYVVPPADFAEGEEFAVALAAALEAHGLAATAAGTPANRIVRLEVAVAPSGDRERVAMTASVLEPDGEPVVSVARADPAPAGDVGDGDPFVLAALADALAADLAASLAPAPIEQVALPGFPGARLVVLPISGAPGDGADSLPAALRAELERRDLPLARDPGPEDLLIAGRVEVVPDGPGAERATISWRLLRTAPDGAPGEEIGRIAQANRIPEGSLDGRWGQVARLVADYAADGLEDLLGQAAARDR